MITAVDARYSGQPIDGKIHRPTVAKLVAMCRDVFTDRS
jgi:hypothetical protein